MAHTRAEDLRMEDIQIGRPRLAPLHTRSISVATEDSDSSDTTPGPGDDEETEYFVAHTEDPYPSLGVGSTDMDCRSSMDLEYQHRITPISKLPPELLIAILAKLSTTADLRNCMLVSYHFALYAVGILWHRPLCNKWHNLLNVVFALGKGSESYFPYHEMVKRLNLSAIADKISDGTVQPFMSCKSIERLTLTNCTKLTDFAVAGLVDDNRKLQALDVTDLEALTDMTLHKVADNCPKLQGLNVTNCSNVTDESLVRVAENCRQLKRLKLNGVAKATDLSIVEVAKNCRSILEIDLAGCSAISSDSVTALLENLSHLRELRLAHCVEIADPAFTNLRPNLQFDALRILDLTACEQVRDDAIARIIPAAPRLRNLVLAKCRHITDRAVLSICKLTKNLHYIHLGHCVNLTDAAIINLVKSCNRIRYIDLACCQRLTDASVRHLAQLPKLRRIGLVKCQNLTDASIMALAHGPILFSGGKFGMPAQFVSLERVHLSYCTNLTLKGITALLHNCPRLTHLSLTGVQAFLREDLTRFCRDAPAEFTHPQRDVFCVFSGDGVQRLREYLLRMAMDEMEAGGQVMDEDLLEEESPGNDTVSDDGTIDGNDHTMDVLLGAHPRSLPTFATPRIRPRPHSLHDLPRYHVDMPLFTGEQMQRVGHWTPNAPLTPELRASIGPAHLNLMSSTHFFHQDTDSDRRPRSPALHAGFDLGEYTDRARSSSRGQSRRHTLESLDGIYGPPPPPPPPLHAAGIRVHTSFYPSSESSVRPNLSQTNLLAPPVPARRITSQPTSLANRVRAELGHPLRNPEGYSAFDENYDAIMATIPGSRGASRHPSRSNSPNMTRVNSRSRLGHVLFGTRPASSSHLSLSDLIVRRPGSSRSRERIRREEELQALAAADAARQLSPNMGGQSSFDGHVSLPTLPPELMETIPATPITPTEHTIDRNFVAGHHQGSDGTHDVNMTQ